MGNVGARVHFKQTKMKMKPEFLPEGTWQSAKGMMQGVLDELGMDTTSPGLHDTPARFVAMLAEAIRGPEPFAFTTFKSETDEMVVVRDIPFSALCEHHLMPFMGTATVAYVPRNKQVGLSKIPRALAQVASGPNNQERIGGVLADLLVHELDPKGVAVLLRCRHSCMEARGVKAHGAETITSKLLGVFLDKPEARAEFMAIALSK